MKKNPHWFTVGLAVFALSASCGGNGGEQAGQKQVAAPTASKEPIEIEVWIHAGGENELNTKMLKDFEARSDIRVKIIELPEETYNKQVDAAMQGAGITGGLPSLLEFDGPNTYNYVWRGMLRPLDEYVDATMRADFLPSIIAQGTYQDGKLYSLGQFDSGLAIWANRKQLQEAKLRIPTVAAPWSRAEFEDALARLKKLPGIEYPLDLKMNYGPIGEWFTYGFSPVLQSFGADLIDRGQYRKASGTLNSPQAVAAMRMIRDWFKKGYVNADQTSDTDFMERKSALSWVGFWTMAPYLKALGDDLMLIPMPDFGTGPKTGMGSWNWGITNKATHPEAAWKVLEFMVAPKQVAEMSELAGAPPARKSVMAASKLYGPGGLLHLYIEQFEAGFAVPRPITPVYPTISQSFAEAFNNIARGADPQSELDKAARRIDKDIEDHKGYTTP